MKHGSLFSGIGGFDLASEWVGWENVFQVENDKFCNKVLKKNFPKVKRYGDIKEFKGQEGQCDIISGGFPCQPFSQAGKRQGETDDRYLWPEMLRVISEIKPLWVVGENVAGLLSMENGKTFERIFTDLETEGYSVEPFIIPACSVGAWHRRDRVWIIAYSFSNSKRCAYRGDNRKYIGNRKEQNEHEGSKIRSNTPTICGDVPNTEGTRINGVNRNNRSKTGKDGNRNDKFNSNSKNVTDTDRTGNRTSKSRTNGNRQEKNKGQKGQSQPEFSRYDKTITENYWEFEPKLGRVADGIPNRVDRLKGLGNAIVPQVAYEIFKAIDNESSNLSNSHR